VQLHTSLVGTSNQCVQYNNNNQGLRYVSFAIMYNLIIILMTVIIVMSVCQ